MLNRDGEVKLGNMTFINIEYYVLINRELDYICYKIGIISTGFGGSYDRNDATRV